MDINSKSKKLMKKNSALFFSRVYFQDFFSSPTEEGELSVVTPS